MTPLSELPAGKSCVVQQLEGGHRFAARLAVLGFTVGAEVRIIQNYGHGPVLVNVRGARVALGRGEATKIQVDPA